MANSLFAIVDQKKNFRAHVTGLRIIVGPVSHNLKAAWSKCHKIAMRADASSPEVPREFCVRQRTSRRTCS
jgi:hypothetical protein